MRLGYDLIVFDLEANQPSGKIIEIGAVKLLRDFSIHPIHFSELIQIDEALGSCQTRQGTKTITELTGISEEMLTTADTFPEVYKRFVEWAYSETSNIVLASWGCWDAVELREECKRHGIDYKFRGKTIDIKSVMVFLSAMMGVKVKSDSLSSIMRTWNLNFAGTKHRGKDDALNTAFLLKKACKHYETNLELIHNSLKKIGL